MMKDQSAFLGAIKRESLLDLVPGLMDLFIEKGEIRMVEVGESICFQSQNADRLIIPITDSLRLSYSSSGSGNDSLLGYVQKFRSVALREVITGEKYPYTATAETPTTVMSLKREDFIPLIEGRPEIRHYLLLITSNSGVRSFRRILTDAKVPAAEVYSLFSRIGLTPIKIEVGEVLEPKEPKMFFVKSGRLLITPRDSSREAVTISEGSYFGGRAFVAPGRWDYSVRAIEPTILNGVSFSEAETYFSRNRLIESLYDEPWIFGQVSFDGETHYGSEVTKLPGRILEADEIRSLDLGLDISSLRRARSDSESIFACVSNLALLLGMQINISNLKTEIGFEGKATFLNIAEVLEDCGCYCRIIKSTRANLHQQPMPSIVPYGPRLCLLVGVKEGIVYLLDPCSGVIAVSFRDFGKLWDRRILEVEKSNWRIEASQKKLQASTGPRLGEIKETDKDVEDEVSKIFRGMVNPFRVQLANVIGLSLGALGLSLLIPLFSQHILDEVLTLRDSKMLVVYTVGFLLTMAFSVFIAVVKMQVLGEFAYRYDQKLSALFYQKALSLPTTFFANAKVGEILARMNEIYNIRQFLSGSSIQSIVDGLSLIVYAVVLFVYSWKIAVIALALLPVAFLINYAFRSKLKRNYEAAFKLDAKSKSLVTEQISAIGTIKAAGAEDIMRRKWEGVALEGVNTKRQNQMTQSFVQGLLTFLASMVRLGGLWMACYLAIGGELSPGEIMAVGMYLDNTIGPISKIANLFAEFQQVRVAFRKVGEVLRAESEQDPASALSSHSMILRGKVRFERVSFRYTEDSPWVLRDISLTIYPNQMVAVVGKSGCGKTTLAKLMAGQIKPTSGRIFFDDFDSSFLSLSSLRRQIGYIMQSNDLFAGSIGDNIGFCDLSPSEEDLHLSAREANAAGFISKFPQGYSHFLAEGGLGLSGGQKQRVSIARTLYRKPKVLIMDEATSALDAESEKAIMENMKSILQGKTALVIAHRLSTIRDADRILVMRDGEIVEEGTHSVLLNRDSHYSELFKGQADAGET